MKIGTKFVYFPFLNSLGDMPFKRVKNYSRYGWQNRFVSGHLQPGSTVG